MKWVAEEIIKSCNGKDYYIIFGNYRIPNKLIVEVNHKNQE